MVQRSLFITIKHPDATPTTDAGLSRLSASTLSAHGFILKMLCTRSRCLLFYILYLGRTAVASSPCSFCTRGEITTPERPLPIAELDVVDSCGYLDEIIGLMLTEDDPQCQQLQAFSTYCGCPPPDDSCTFCPDGSRVADPDREMPWLAEFFDGISPTCELAEAYLASLPSNDDTCGAIQLLSTYCGCPVVPDHCVLCKEGLKEEFYDVEIHIRSFDGTSVLFDGTCELLFEMQHQIAGDSTKCDAQKFLVHLCGCNEGLLPYMGTSTVEQQQALLWIPRGMATLSLSASASIFYTILRSRVKRRSVYNQMMLLIAAFDVITSLVWLIGTAAIPEINDVTDQPWGIYGASGNDATCTISGFFIQLGTITHGCCWNDRLPLPSTDLLLTFRPIPRYYFDISERLSDGILSTYHSS